MVVTELIPAKEMEVRRAQATVAELEAESGLTDEAPLYRAFGKAYLRSSKSAVVKILQDSQHAATEQLEKLRLRKSVIENTVTELEKQQQQSKQ